MITYKILVKDENGNQLGEFQKYRNLKFGKRLNNYGTCSFDVPVNDPKAASLIALRLYTIEIYREGVLLWAGEQALRSGDLDDQGDNWATITCNSWLEQLNSRYTVAEKIYDYQDGGDIAWDLINTTQSDTDGDLGIVQGTMDATTWREKTYTNQNIMEAIISLANLADGFDFEITDTKVFNVYNSIGVDRTASIILEYGVNMRNVRITEDFSKPATRAIVLGQTGTVGDQVRIERDDTAGEAQYGLREYIASQMEVSDLTTFQATGDAITRKYGAPLLKISMDIVRGATPTIDDFALGDVIRLKIQSGIYDIDDSFRVSAWTVAYNTDDTETLTLTLSDFYLGGMS